MGAHLTAWKLRFGELKRVVRLVVVHPYRFMLSEEKVDAAIVRIEADMRALEAAIERAVAMTLIQFFGEAAHRHAACREVASRLRRDLMKEFGFKELRHQLDLLRSL